jgi:hypothetical protein
MRAVFIKKAETCSASKINTYLLNENLIQLKSLIIVEIKFFEIDKNFPGIKYVFVSFYLDLG